MRGRRFVMCGGLSACVAQAHAAAVSDPRGRFRLEYVGSFAATMREGARAGQISVAALRARGVWAVGPTEDLTGELTVLDGTAFVATMAHGQVRVVEDARASAPFLVWAEVER